MSFQSKVYVVHHNLNNKYEVLVKKYASCFKWRFVPIHIVDKEKIKEDWPVIVVRSQKSRTKTDMEEALHGLNEEKRKRTIYMLCRRSSDGSDSTLLFMERVANPELLGQLVVPTPKHGVDKCGLKELQDMLKSFYTPKRIGK
ncbi:uncharacterized protein LOC128551078 [Mercenaria mercenaria]|uniref:uncharacterized protein LOC128551078 n=1 Tax=Mercenaria mercenaria TaxID=6596 RepID=UPI00234EA9E9|nr:uncharacterized protein LOC128551078 [Mercenaria mercenaria]